jgi:hypothetical protein
MMLVVKFINERLNSDTVRKEVLDNGDGEQETKSPTTGNKEVTLLSSIFRMAIDRGCNIVLALHNMGKPNRPSIGPCGPSSKPSAR